MRVFLASTANFATGGTELMHQFCKCLRDNGIECYMIYSGADGVHCPIPEPFLKYDIKYVTHFVDADDTVLVLTETQVHLLNSCVKGTVMVWWLSVDNYFVCYQEMIKKNNKIDIFDLKSRKDIIHFVQSHYAKDFLEKQIGIKDSYFLMDYINDDIVETAVLYQNTYERENICLYNPKKGYEVLKPVIESCRGDIQWIPLTGYKPVEMAMLMCKAKVYIDFGPHPGKDRIPREAALCGCLVLTNRKGSAAYQEDVGIPECYKVEDIGDIDAVLEKIYDLVDHYQERKGEYSGYLEAIAGEKAGFMEDLQVAIAILKDCVKKRECLVQFDGRQYGEIMGSISGAANQVSKLASSARGDCEAGNRSEAINKLLTIDYVIQVIQETISVELKSLAELEEG